MSKTYTGLSDMETNQKTEFPALKESLARKFSAIMRDWLTPQQMAEVIRLNKTEAYLGACATHNYCDSNMAMAEAFESVIGREPDVSSDSDCDMWNHAWDIAQENEFNM